MAKDAPDGVYKGCGKPLERHSWNRDVDIVYCGDYNCPLSHVPVRPAKRKGGRPSGKTFTWVRGSNDSQNSIFTSRLQRLRETLLTKDEETEIL